jgi:uncharacterized membrane protein YkvI
MHHITALRVPRALKAAFLFIGSAVGAGFSTGREIALFFGDASPLNVAFSGVFTALLCLLFMIAGKRNLIPRTPFVQFFVLLAALISLCAMLAGSDLILKNLFGIPMFGLIFGAAGSFIVIAGIEKIRFLNTICSPLVIIMVAILFFMSDMPSHSGGFLFFKPLLYSGLDVLLAGVVMADEGKDMTYRQIGVSSLLICVFMFAILYMLQSVVLTDTGHTAMPVYTVASALNVKWVCGTLIAAAIFTTLVSSLHVVTEKTRFFIDRLKSAKKLYKVSILSLSKNRAYIVGGVLLVAYPLSFLGFENIVDFGYPFVSACGIGFTALVILKMIILAVQKAKLKKETRLKKKPVECRPKKNRIKKLSFAEKKQNREKQTSAT